MYKHMQQYPVIALDKPFTGIPESTATYNADQDQFYIDYSGALYNDNAGNLTLTEYDAIVRPIEVITWEELDKRETEFHKTLITSPKEITEDQWTYALEVLPPCRWHNAGSVNVFFVSERITGNMVNWYARKDGKYYHFVDNANVSDADICIKFHNL